MGPILTNDMPTHLMTKEHCVSDHLDLTKEKTVWVVFKTKNKNTDTGMAGIDCKTNVKYLGIVNDFSLSCNPHVNQLCKKLSSGTFLIYRLKQVCTPKVTRKAYFTFLESHVRQDMPSGKKKFHKLKKSSHLRKKELLDT
ncbi:hypothetical protein J6590_000185 [Homalodisca vitripennis]|nr:hypothetical protein J6590_000185 [Homalodisca vitripennis]